MEDEQDDMYIEPKKMENIRRCQECKVIHFCSRCIKNMHICYKCGKLTHDCDICGIIMYSLSEIKKHQKESNICKKARMLTATSFEEQLSKAGIKVVKKHARRSSLPSFTTDGVIS